MTKPRENFRYICWRSKLHIYTLKSCTKHSLFSRQSYFICHVITAPSRVGQPPYLGVLLNFYFLYKIRIRKFLRRRLTPYLGGLIYPVCVLGGYYVTDSCMKVLSKEPTAHKKIWRIWHIFSLLKILLYMKWTSKTPWHFKKGRSRGGGKTSLQDG